MDGGEYVSMAGEFNDLKKVLHSLLTILCSNKIFRCVIISWNSDKTLFSFIRLPKSSGTWWKQWLEKQKALKICNFMMETWKWTATFSSIFRNNQLRSSLQSLLSANFNKIFLNSYILNILCIFFPSTVWSVASSENSCSLKCCCSLDYVFYSLAVVYN